MYNMSPRDNNMTPEQLTRYQIEQMVKMNLAENLKKLKAWKIPESYIDTVLPSIIYNADRSYINMRSEYIKTSGFALLAQNWIKPLAKWIGDRPCLEVMAGTGMLAYALKKNGVNIIATDNYSWENKFDSIHRKVIRMDAIEAVKRYGEKVKFIICSWPYMDNTAYQILMTMRQVNPKCRMIYIGESWGGCTADDAFFDAVEECNVTGFEEAVSKYRRWEGIHDYIQLVK